MIGILYPFLVVLSAVLGQFLLAQHGGFILTLCSLSLFVLSAVLFIKTDTSKKDNPNPLSPWAEMTLLPVILVAAVFFRTYHLDRFPSGLCLDQAVPALGSLMVLNGWHPFFETPLLDCPSLPLYPGALWFKFFQPTALNAALLTATYSFLALIVTYLFFRKLAGVGPALCATALGAVCHWDAYLCRWAGIDQLPFFFAYGSLFLLSHGSKSGKRWPFWAAGLWVGLGFYGYYSYRVFPVIVVLVFLYEITRVPQAFQDQKGKWLAFGLTFLAVLSPLICHWAQTPQFGQGYPAEQFVGWTIVEQKSLMPLVENTGKFLGLFGRQGDPSPKQTTDQMPMLDPVTHFLAVIGLVWALWNWRQRVFFYTLAVFFGFSLTDILSTDPTNISHVFPLLPCVLFWAGQALWSLTQRVGQGPWKAVLPVLCCVLIAGLNADELFRIQEKDNRAPIFFDLGPTLAGQEIARLGSQYQMILCPSFGPHLTVRFLAFDHLKDFRQWDWPRDLAFAQAPLSKEGVCFILTRGEAGILELLKELYPDASVTVLNDPQGSPLVYEVKVTSALLRASRGMKWTPGSSAKKAFRRTGAACWFVPESGSYRFGSRGARQVLWEVDGNPVRGNKAVALIRGYHSLKVRVTKADLDTLQLWQTDPEGRRIPLDENCLTQLSLDRGLLVQYEKEDSVVFEQWDPVVNYVSKADFYSNVSTARWSGQIFAPATGEYSFLALTQSTDKANLSVDQKPLTPWGPSPSGAMTLKKGWHRFEIGFQMGDGYFSAMNLAWKTPRENRYRPVPLSALGPVNSSIR